jgi:2-dehydropantoate 2-reductase
VCAQNGVDNERQALRRFEDVYAMCVMMPARHHVPGVVELSPGVPGVLDVGRYPEGVDDATEQITADLRQAGFVATPHPAIMERKYRKLLANLVNVLDAAAGASGRASWLAEAARAEAHSCLAAAGVIVGSAKEDADRRAYLNPPEGANPPPVSSTWQSMERGEATLETPYLNGEIVLVGRLHGVATPVNQFLTELGENLVRRRQGPGTIPISEIEAAARSHGVNPPTDDDAAQGLC